MKRAFCRCIRGHFHVGESCPIDGWHSAESAAITRAVQDIQNNGEQPTIEALRRAGLSTDAMRRVIVIEFGDEQAVFDGIVPRGYMLDGRWVELDDVDERFL